MKNVILCFAVVAMAYSLEVQAKVNKAGPCASVLNSVPVYNQMSQALEGCRLEVVERDSVYAGLGFKPGDVIQPNSEKNKLESFQQLKAAEPDRSTAE